MAPSTRYDHVLERLDQLPAAARLVLILDPKGKLGLADEIATAQHTWKVLRYDGNDLAFRRRFTPTDTTLVWVTGSRIQTEHQLIELTSLVDVVRRADGIINASLLGSLEVLLPAETWPEGPISAYEDIIGSRLGDFIRAYQNLKPHLGSSAALNTYSIQSLVLACLQPSIQPIEFMFRVDSPVALLKKYVTLAWTLDWDEAGLKLLQEQASNASLLSLGGLAAWFDVDLQGLAQLIYFYRTLSMARVPNIINQIRGLGLLSFDPEPLEAGLGQVMVLWEKDLSWRNRLIQLAEADLELDTIHRATDLLATDTNELVKNLTGGEAPALVYSLAARLIENSMIDGKLKELLQAWKENRPVILDRVDENSTVYAPFLLALGSTLDEAAFIQDRILQAIAVGST